MIAAHADLYSGAAGALANSVFSGVLSPALTPVITANNTPPNYHFKVRFLSVTLLLKKSLVFLCIIF